MVPTVCGFQTEMGGGGQGNQCQCPDGGGGGVSQCCHEVGEQAADDSFYKAEAAYECSIPEFSPKPKALPWCRHIICCPGNPESVTRRQKQARATFSWNTKYASFQVIQYPSIRQMEFRKTKIIERGKDECF